MDKQILFNYLKTDCRAGPVVGFSVISKGLKSSHLLVWKSRDDLGLIYDHCEVTVKELKNDKKILNVILPPKGITGSSTSSEEALTLNDLKLGEHYEVIFKFYFKGKVISTQKEQFCKNLVQNELLQLVKLALSHIMQLSGKCISSNHTVPALQKILVFYRNKPAHYYNYIMTKRAGLMEPYLKNFGGDPGCPLNGKMNGLFFSASTVLGNPNLLPLESPFGELRFVVPCVLLLNVKKNLYFADFYCHYNTHHITLVVSSHGTHVDTFCRKTLIPLNLFDNPFLRLDLFGNCYLLQLHCLWIEIFYTDFLNLYTPFCYIYKVPTFGRGTSNPRGIKKKVNCKVCNISGEEN